jgi:hypothetical protein
VLATRLASMAQCSLTAGCLGAVLALPGCVRTAAATKSKSPPVVATVAREDKASPALQAFLNERVQQELKALELQGEKWPVGYTADASILKLDHASRTSLYNVSCTVLLTLLDSTHSPVALVRGNASAAGVSHNGSLAREAVGGATHSAVSQLPGAFRRLQAVNR